MSSSLAEPAATTSEHEALHRERLLQDWLRARGSVLVGFSGGVDSAYLAAVAVDTLGRDSVLAVIGRSASYPAAQWATARAVADRFEIPVLEVNTDEMSDPRYAANPVNRCYFCKSELWDRLAPIAAERGHAVVIDGTNADDRSDYRPGAAAARERSVASPLAEAGLTKADIRLLSERRGIPTWSQPSSPCLSSRLPYGTAVTPARLAQVERAEAALRTLGLEGDLRVRFHDDLARVEIAAEQLQHWLHSERAHAVVAAVVAAGFARCAIDLRGFRSGSLNVLGSVTAASPDDAVLVESAVPEAGAPGATSGAGARGSAMSETVQAEASAELEARDARLEQSLARSGLPARVEGRRALAVVTVVDGAPSIDAVRRRAIVRAAHAAGFSHIALEIAPPRQTSRVAAP